MPRLALYTFGVLRDVPASAMLRDFVELGPQVFAEAGTVDGFIAHAAAARPDLIGKAKNGQDYGRWGIAVAPRYYTGSTKAGEDRMITTLSLWRDIEAARRFSYGGLHRAALKRRREWFEEPRWPGHVAWWVGDDETPSWGEGARRLEALGDDGPTAAGFDLATCFDPEGRKIVTVRAEPRVVAGG